ncbi:hypothetical protein [Streptomyces sp. NPDC058240]|uniref:hypothetical protein n=1 Tax=Streptomyces sp. NPDC058240 TaxID=3346396 RepID=UPI0036F186FE
MNPRDRAPARTSGVVVVLAVTFLLALVIAVRGTAPAQRAAVLRAFAELVSTRRR